MCPLQIIIDNEPLSLTIHGVNTTFIHPQSNVENYSISNPQKNTVLENIFLHLYTPFTGFGHLIWNTNGRKSSLNFFDICKIGT